MVWETLASAQDVFATSATDNTRSQAEVLSKLVQILLTQHRKGCPDSHGPAEDSDHLRGQWAGLLTRPVYSSETQPKVIEENFVCVSSISSEWPFPSLTPRGRSLTLLGHRGHF